MITQQHSEISSLLSETVANQLRLTTVFHAPVCTYLFRRTRICNSLNHAADVSKKGSTISTWIKHSHVAPAQYRLMKMSYANFEKPKIEIQLHGTKLPFTSFMCIFESSFENRKLFARSTADHGDVFWNIAGSNGTVNKAMYMILGSIFDLVQFLELCNNISRK